MFDSMIENHQFPEETEQQFEARCQRTRKEHETINKFAEWLKVERMVDAQFTEFGVEAMDDEGYQGCSVESHLQSEMLGDPWYCPGEGDNSGHCYTFLSVETERILSSEGNITADGSFVYAMFFDPLGELVKVHRIALRSMVNMLTLYQDVREKLGNLELYRDCLQLALDAKNDIPPKAV